MCEKIFLATEKLLARRVVVRKLYRQQRALRWIRGVLDDDHTSRWMECDALADGASSIITMSSSAMTANKVAICNSRFRI